MFKALKGAYGVTYNEKLEPRVAFWDAENHCEGEVLTGKEAERFLTRRDRITFTFSILFLPLSAVFYLLVGIHNAIEWLLGKFMA